MLKMKHHLCEAPEAEGTHPLVKQDTYAYPIKRGANFCICVLNALGATESAFSFHRDCINDA